MLGIGWASLVSMFGSPIRIDAAIQLSFQTQVAKYLPGNVFHHVGRVVLAKRHGVKATVATLATVVESVLLLAIAALFGLSFLLSLGYGWIVLAVVAAGTVASLLVVRSGFLADKLGLASFRNRLSSSYIPIALLAFILVFIFQTTMFLMIASELPDPLGFGFFRALEMISVTWGAGFVVIGAPGGLGVREAAYSLFASAPEVKSSLLYVASWMRVCSLVGDLICFGISKLILKGSVRS